MGSKVVSGVWVGASEGVVVSFNVGVGDAVGVGAVAVVLGVVVTDVVGVGVVVFGVVGVGVIVGVEVGVSVIVAVGLGVTVAGGVEVSVGAELTVDK
jgi:hypothetical protein